MLLRPDTFANLCRARDLLGEIPEAPLSIKNVARDARLSNFHFIPTFEAAFGVTPHQFRMRARLDRAKVLLAKGELTVTEVCMAVGMSSLGSFSDLFTRRTRRESAGFSMAGARSGAGARLAASPIDSRMLQSNGTAAGLRVAQF